MSSDSQEVAFAKYQLEAFAKYQLEAFAKYQLVAFAMRLAAPVPGNDQVTDSSAVAP